jgi:hypothetical protein
MPRDLEYEENNIGYDDDGCFGEPGGKGIKCKNYELCKTVLPLWWYDCKGCYICTICDVQFGTWSSGDTIMTGKGALEFKDDIECPVCLETTRGVTPPNCEHFICIHCFKRCYYGNDEPKDPEFPYPKIEEDYFSLVRPEEKYPDEIYPLIEAWNEECKRCDEEREDRYREEEYLRHCPICRK